MVIWVTTPLPVWHSPVTLPPARTYSMVSTSSTLRARMWLPVSVPPSRLLSRVHAAGLLFRVSQRRNALPNIPRLRSQCLYAPPSLSPSLTSLRVTSRTCRIWSSQSRTASSGCSRPVTVSAQVRLWSASPWSCFVPVKSTRRQPCSVWNPRNSTSFSTPSSTRTLSSVPSWWPRGFPHLPVPQPVRLYSSQMTLRLGPRRKRKLSSSVSRHHPKTSAVWLWLRVSSQCAAV